MSVSQWMSWEGGVDLAASTVAGSDQPNLIVHVARVVHTPVGSAPSGIVFYMPDPNAPPAFIGFVSSDLTVGAYFGPQIFAGTPFENVPVLQATISIDTSDAPNTVSATVSFDGFTIKTQLSGLLATEQIDRAAGAPMPFRQTGLEAEASILSAEINGEALTLYPVPVSPTGGASAVWAPVGIYTR